MRSTVLPVRTGSRTTTDLTGLAARWLSDIDAGDGLLHAFAPHATAGLALVELGAGSEPDVEEALGRLLPRDGRWVHAHGSPGHGADHVLPVLIAPSLVVPVVAGAMALGTWQRLVLVDTNVDNPDRQLRLSFLAG